MRFLFILLYPLLLISCRADFISIDPASVQRGGQDIAIKIAGKHTAFEGGKTFVDFNGNGIEVKEIFVVDKTTVHCTITIADNVVTGLRSVYVTYPNGSILGKEIFDVRE